MKSKENIKPVKEILGSVLTGMLEQQTKARPANTKAWAEWLQLEIYGDEQTQASLTSMVEAAAQFVLDVRSGQKPYWLSLLGESGTGKTMVAKRIWKWFKGTDHFRSSVKQNGREIIYGGEWCYWPNVANDLQNNSGYGRLEDLATERFVVFDEIGSERDINAHVRDHLARVLSSRVGRWTLITSNKKLEQVASDIDVRVASRMVRDGSVVVEITAKDFATTEHPDADERILMRELGCKT